MRRLAIVWCGFLIAGAAGESRAGLEIGGAGDTTGALSGTVTSVVTQQPVVGATVTLDREDGATATDLQGRFRLVGLSAGTYRLVVRAAGHLPQQITDLVVTAGRDTPVAIHLQDAPARAEAVDVAASYFVKADDVPTGATAMGYEEVRRAPGALGDVSRLVQTLPGAMARDDGRNDIIARGGSPTENLILVDNLEVPNLSHFGAQGGSGGPITMLNAEAVSEVNFMAGGFPAAYGHRLSSVLEVGLREGNRQRMQLELDLGMAGAGFLAEGPIAKRGSWLATARKSYLDLIAGAFSLTAIPQYSNYQVKAVYDLSPVHQLSFVSLGGYDSIEFRADMAETEDPETWDLDDVGWRAVAGVNLRSLLGRSGVGVLSVGHSESSFRVDIWDLMKGGQLYQHNASREGETTAKYDVTHTLGSVGSMRAGVYAKRFGSTLTITQPMGVENPFSSDATRINVLDLKLRPAAWQGGGYAQASARFAQRATLTLGGRFDRFDQRAVSRWSPRGGLTLHLRRNLDLSASAGRYYQMPPLLATDSMPQNALLDPIRADHYVAGVTYLPKPAFKLTAEVYRKRYTGYPVSTQMPNLTLADMGDAFDGGYLMPLASAGLGHADGIELFAQKKLSRALWGQVSYAYSRTESRALDGVWRASIFDLPHALALVGGWQMGRGFELSTKFSYTSGRPNLPFDLAESERQNRAVYDLARFKSERLPAYHRLDLRLDRRTAHKWGNLVFYVEAENVYNRNNVRMYLWNAKTRQPEAVSQLKMLVMGGVNVEF